MILRLQCRLIRTLPLLPLLVACGSEADRPPDVLIISLDTLRADHLSCYGYGKPTTPRLDQLADGATLYTRCMATAPWTVPSHASIMTGRFPSEHGAISSEMKPAAGQYSTNVDNAQPLGPENLTLAEVLRDDGYATAAFVANTTYLQPHMGLAQGFDSWVIADPWLRRDVSPAWSPELTDRTIRWLRRHVEEGAGQPFLLFLNYFDTHRPYNVSPESAHRSFEALEALYTRVMIDGQPAGESAEVVIDHFDRALTHLDRSLGEVFDTLKELELFDGMLIVITSDHGEFFGEHGLVEHSKDVYQETLHVPLIIKQPGQTEARVDEQLVSLVDIARVVLDAIPGTLGERYARTFPYEIGSHPIWAENHFSRPRDLMNPVVGPRFQRRRFALYEDSLKFIYSSDGEHELYDLAVDPRETQDLVEERPNRVRALSVRAEKLLVRAKKISADAKLRELSPEEAADMRSMGYGGSDEDGEDGEGGSGGH